MIRIKKVRFLRKYNVLLPSLTQKKPSKRKNKPGEHPFFYSKKTAISRSFSDRLKDKQKLKLIFCINEKQLRNYIKLSLYIGRGKPFVTLYNILHLRFDYIIYILNFAQTILEARQLINHGHFFINKKKQKNPGYICTIGSFITTKSMLAKNNINNFLNRRVHINNTDYLELSRNNYEGFIKIKPFNINFNILKLIQSAFEFYK